MCIIRHATSCNFFLFFVTLGAHHSFIEIFIFNVHKILLPSSHHICALFLVHVCHTFRFAISSAALKINIPNATPMLHIENSSFAVSPIINFFQSKKNRSKHSSKHIVYTPLYFWPQTSSYTAQFSKICRRSSSHRLWCLDPFQIYFQSFLLFTSSPIPSDI